jgi:hypothetical protein
LKDVIENYLDKEAPDSYGVTAIAKTKELPKHIQKAIEESKKTKEIKDESSHKSSNSSETSLKIEIVICVLFAVK